MSCSPEEGGGNVIKGDGKRKLSELELKTLKIARRSIYAKKSIKKGQIITNNMINIVRPLEGIEPKYKKDVIGKELLFSGVLNARQQLHRLKWMIKSRILNLFI